ncbi:hypothetical protein [Actinomyces vulturis]|uniref:hypothetical protein n=1 Tax=Actinomyces vulturis TaxID=1857645 RepID=UPI00082C9251|nr:hypothetical protein [Actinomyces vulturis]
MMISRRSALLSALIAASASLAACSNDLPSIPEGVGASPEAQPVLDGERLSTILERISDGVAVADKDKNADQLTGFLTGPAKRIRTEQYALAQATGKDDVVKPLVTTSQASAVGLTLGWPRTVMTATEFTDTTNIPQLLTLSQDSARDPFELWAWIRLFPGVEIPPTAKPATGSPQVDLDTAGLIMTPQDALASYVEALNDPNSISGHLWADDPLRSLVEKQRALNDSLKDVGNIAVSVTAGSDGVRGLQTEDGGALVMTTLTITSVYSRTVPKSTMKVSGDVAALAGGEDLKGKITATYDVMVAFSLPAAKDAATPAPESSAATSAQPSPAPSASAAATAEASPQQAVRPTAIGAEYVLASAVRDDAAAPADE